MTRRARLSLEPEGELRKAPPQGPAPLWNAAPKAASAQKPSTARIPPDGPSPATPDPGRTSAQSPPSRPHPSDRGAEKGLPAWLDARTLGKALLVVGLAAASIFLLKRRL
jgi:hypothetical protein